MQADCCVALNLRLFVYEIPGTRSEMKLKLRPLTPDVRQCAMHLTLSSVLIKEGDAIDDDMQSISSAMQPIPNDIAISDVGNMMDIDEQDFSPCRRPVHDTNGSIDHHQVSVAITKVSNEIEAWKNDEQKRSSIENELVSPVSMPSTLDGVSDTLSFTDTVPATSSIINQVQSPIIASVPSSQTDEQSHFTTVIRQNSSSKPAISATNDVEDLLTWCQRLTKDYTGVRIADFSKSWRSGLGFCAIIHHFRPDLIGEFNKLDFTDSPSAIRENCRKAFDAASSLGVSRSIDIDDLVIMKVPDKVAVNAFIRELRTVLTGNLWKQTAVSPSPTSESSHRFSYLYGLSEADSKIMDEFEKLRREREEADAIDLRNEPLLSEGNVQWAAVAKLETRNVDGTNDSTKTPLMKRRELMHPFDSDSDEEKNKLKANNHISPSKHEPDATTVIPTTSDNGASSSGSDWHSTNLPKLSIGGTRHEELKRRARQLLDMPSSFDSHESTPSLLDDDDRKRRLHEEARRLIDQVQTDGSTIRISDSSIVADSVSSTKIPRRRISVPRTKTGSNSDLRKLDAINPSVEFYRFRKIEPSPNLQRTAYPQPVVPALGRSRESLAIYANEYVEQEQSTMNDSTFDRMKRYGSMRRQELTDSISILSARLAHGYRSTSLPKELSNLTMSLASPQRSMPHSMSAVGEEEMTRQGMTRKVDTNWEKDLASQNTLANKQQRIAARLKVLQDRDAELAKLMPLTNPGTPEEQELLSEKVRILNERDDLIRREDYYNILESIGDVTARFSDVQHELGALIAIEEDDKTESEKRKIDQLMQELVNLVNKKDELTQKLGEIEAETNEANERNRQTLEHTANFNRSVNEPLSASKRLITWFRS